MPRDHVEHETEHHNENHRADADEEQVQVIYVVRDDRTRLLQVVLALTACRAYRKRREEAGQDLRDGCGHGCPQTMAWESLATGSSIGSADRAAGRSTAPAP